MPQPFTTVSPILASYSFIEILENQGYADFYPMTYKTLSTEHKVMSTAVRKTSSAYTSLKNAQSADFDTGTLPQTRIAEGKVYIEYTMALSDNYSGAASGHWVFNLYIVSPDATETLLGTGIGEGLSHDASGVGDYTASVISFDISKVSVKAGYFLRLTLDAVARTSGSGDNMLIWHDPQSISVPSGTLSSQLKLSIPFNKSN